MFKRITNLFKKRPEKLSDLKNRGYSEEELVLLSRYRNGLFENMKSCVRLENLLWRIYMYFFLKILHDELGLMISDSYIDKESFVRECLLRLEDDIKG